MKHELIKTDNYLLIVDDSEIKKMEWFLPISGIGLDSNKPRQADVNMGYDNHHCKKIIAHLPLNNTPILEGVPLLPPFEVKDDVEKFAREDGGYDNFKDIVIYSHGYNKAKEKYKFTEDDMMKAYRLGNAFQNSDSLDFKEIFDNLIKSISQPKMPTHFEFEMEVIGVTDDGMNKIEEPKTTTNAQGQVVVCGKYIYE